MSQEKEYSKIHTKQKIWVLSLTQVELLILYTIQQTELEEILTFIIIPEDLL